MTDIDEVKKEPEPESNLKIFTREELSALIIRKHERFLTEYKGEFSHMKGEDQMKDYAKGRAVVMRDKEDLLKYWVESLENEKNDLLSRKRQILTAPVEIEKIEKEIQSKRELAESLDENRKRRIEWEIEKLNSEIDDLKKLMESDVAGIDNLVAGLEEGIQRYAEEAAESKNEMNEMQELSDKPLTSNYQYDWLDQRIKSHDEALRMWRKKNKAYKI